MTVIVTLIVIVIVIVIALGSEVSAVFQCCNSVLEGCVRSQFEISGLGGSMRSLGVFSDSPVEKIAIYLPKQQ